MNTDKHGLVFRGGGFGAEPGLHGAGGAGAGGAAESLNNGYYGEPKRDLITGLQVLLRRGALQIAAVLKHGPDLVSELTGMRVRVGGEGREQYGAWREGTHDDLVFAVALAYWAARKMYSREAAGKEGYWRFPGWREREREFRKGMEWSGSVTGHNGCPFHSQIVRRRSQIVSPRR